jgi:hypothetical protein
MATLGRLIPPAIAKRIIESRLNPGCVVFIEVRFPRTGEVKRKFAVLLNSADEAWLFVINSKPSWLIEHNPDLAACQVKIDAATHTFLQHDSCIGCEELIRVSRGAVVDDLVRNASSVRGSLSEAVRAQVVVAVRGASTLSPREQEVIVSALTRG